MQGESCLSRAVYSPPIKKGLTSSIPSIPAVEGQNLPCTDLAHHELEHVVVVDVVIIIMTASIIVSI